MEKRWGVFFQPCRSMVRGTGQRPWGEPGTQIELKYLGIFKTPVSSSPSTCRHWLLSFALVFVPRRNYHLRGFHTPDCLSVLVFDWFWDLILGDFVCNLVVMGCHWIFRCFRTIITSLAKVLSFDFQIVFKFRIKISSNLIGIGGSVTEKVAPHFAAFLDLKVGHLNLNNYCKIHVFEIMNGYIFNWTLKGILQQKDSIT